jgi:hypothetical protein
MDTSTGATTVMADVRARDYYRRAGFSDLVIRDRPRVRSQSSLVQIRETYLVPNAVVELIVYPELILRSKPWRYWAKVLRHWEDTVILEHLSGEQAGTIIRIPYRYFLDGRVFRVESLADESD